MEVDRTAIRIETLAGREVVIFWEGKQFQGAVACGRPVECAGAAAVSRARLHPGAPLAGVRRL
jgi:hypothetical protein